MARIADKYSKQGRRVQDKQEKESVSLRILRISIYSIVVGLLGCQTSRLSIQPMTNIQRQEVRLSHSNNKKVNEQDVAKIRTQIAAQYLLNHQLDDASRQLQQALAADISYAPAYDMMGVLLQQEGSANNLAQAEAYFLQAIALDTNFMQAHNNYGVYLTQLGRNQQALKHFEIAGSSLGYSGRIGALENLGLTALKTGNKQLASDAFVRVLDSERDNITAHVELIDILIDSNQVAQAKNLYNELLVLMGERLKDHPRIILQGSRLKQIS